MATARLPPSFMGVVYQPDTLYPTKKKLGPGVGLYNNATNAPADIDKKTGFALLEAGGDYIAERTDSARMKKWSELSDDEQRKVLQMKGGLQKSNTHKFRRSSNTVMGLLTFKLASNSEMAEQHDDSSSSPEKSSLFNTIRNRRRSAEPTHTSNMSALRGLLGNGGKSQSSVDIRGRQPSLSPPKDPEFHVSLNSLDNSTLGRNSSNSVTSVSPGRSKKTMVSELAKQEEECPPDSVISSNDEMSLDDIAKRGPNQKETTSLNNVRSMSVCSSVGPRSFSVKTSTDGISPSEESVQSTLERKPSRRSQSLSIFVPDPTNETEITKAPLTAPLPAVSISNLTQNSKYTIENEGISPVEVSKKLNETIHSEILAEIHPNRSRKGSLKYLGAPGSPYFDPVYAVLEEGVLQLFSNETCKDSLLSVRITENCLAIAQEQEPQPTFHVVQDDESYCFLATTRELMLEWIGVINSASLDAYVSQFHTNNHFPKRTQSGGLAQEEMEPAVFDYAHELSTILTSFDYAALTKITSPAKTSNCQLDTSSSIPPSVVGQDSLDANVEIQHPQAILRRNSSEDAVKYHRRHASLSAVSIQEPTNSTHSTQENNNNNNNNSSKPPGIIVVTQSTTSLFPTIPLQSNTALRLSTSSHVSASADPIASQLSHPTSPLSAISPTEHTSPALNVNNISTNSPHLHDTTVENNSESGTVRSPFKHERIADELYSDQESLQSGNVDVIQEQLRQLQITVEKASENSLSSFVVTTDSDSDSKLLSSEKMMVRLQSTELSGDMSIQYEQHQGVVNCRLIVAGNLDRLIGRLFDEYDPHQTYTDTFLLTHRHFTTGPIVMEKISARVNSVPPETPTDAQIQYVRQRRPVVRVRLATVVKHWVENYWIDFKEGGAARQELDKFLNLLSELKPDQYDTETFEEHKQDLHKVAWLLRKLVYYQEQTYRSLVKAIRPEISKAPIDFMSLDPVDVAHHLTLLEFERLAAVRPIEFALQLWGNVKDPSVECELIPLTEMASSFNQMSYWVATEICTQPELKKRCKVMERMIKIAKVCRRERNYNTLMAIISGLSQSSVIRLKATWESLQDKYRQRLRELEEIVSPQHNYRNYRQIYEQSEREQYPLPFVPFFALFLKDMQFINDGNPKVLANGLINFSKARTVFDKVAMIKRWQNNQFSLPNNETTKDDVMQFCRSLRALKESALYKYSCLCESKVNDGGSVRLVDKWAKEAKSKK